MNFNSFEGVFNLTSDGKITSLQKVVNHALKAHGTSVVGVVNPRNSVGLKLLYFTGQNSPAAAAKNFNVPRAAFLEQVVHELEVLQMPALVGGHGNSVGVFLDGGLHHLLGAAVVAQMNNFGS